MIGQTLNGFEILRPLGSGGMGSVYEALDLALQRRVAIKVLNPELSRDAVFTERFRKEALALARLNHPNITAIYSLFEHGEQLFLVMELVDGDRLDQLLRASGGLPWPEAVEIACEILTGLEHAHAQGIVHRDVKPNNCLLTPQGKVKITDFGIAYVAGRTRLTRSGKVIGTAEYIAPELILGRVPDRRADVYSVGAVLYEMVTGRMPFLATNVQDLVRAQLEQPPIPPRALKPQLPEPLERVILRALAKDPAERFQSAAEMIAALRTGLTSDHTEHIGVPSAVHRDPLPPPPVPSRGWRPQPLLAVAVVALVGVLLVTVAGLVGWFVLGKREGTIAAASVEPRETAPPLAAPVVSEPVAAPVEEPVAERVPEPSPAPVAVPVSEPASAPPPPPEKLDPSVFQLCKLAARLDPAGRRLNDHYRADRGAGDELLSRVKALRTAAARLQEACTGTEPRTSIRQRAADLIEAGRQLRASFPESEVSVSTAATWLMIKDRLDELEQATAARR